MRGRLRAQAQGPVGWSLGASLTIQALGIASGIILARVLDPSGRGELAAVVLWPTIAAVIASIGIQQSSTYFAASQGSDQRLISTVGGLALLQGGLGLAVGLAVVRFTPVLTQYGHGAIDTASLFALYIPLNLTTLSFSGLLNGFGRYKAFQSLRVLVIAGSVAGIALLAVLTSLTPRSAAATYLLAEVVTASTAVLLTVRHAGRPRRPSLELARTISAFGVKSYLGGLSNLVNLRFDQAVLSIVVGPAQYGYYVVATTLTSLTNLVGMSIGFVALPSLARERNARRAVRMGWRYLVITVGLAILVTVPLIVLVPTVIEVAFGSAFSPATAAARILLIAAVSYSTARVLEACLQGLGKPLDSSIGEGIAVLVTVAAILTLVPIFDIEGAAGASLLAYSAAALFMCYRMVLHGRAATTTVTEAPALSLPSTKDERPGGGGSGPG